MELQPFLPPLQRPGLAVHQDAVGGGSALDDVQLDGTGLLEPEDLEVEALDPLVAVHRVPVGHVAAVVRADTANVERECVGLVDVSTGNSREEGAERTGHEISVGSGSRTVGWTWTADPSGDCAAGGEGCGGLVVVALLGSSKDGRATSTRSSLSASNSFL